MSQSVTRHMRPRQLRPMTTAPYDNCAQDNCAHDNYAHGQLLPMTNAPSNNNYCAHGNVHTYYLFILMRPIRFLYDQLSNGIVLLVK